MDDTGPNDLIRDPQAQRIFDKLAEADRPESEDTQMASLFPGFSFDVRLVAGITPIEKDGALDFFIDRPKGMRGWIINLTVDGTGQVFRDEKAFTVSPGDLLLFPPEARHFYGRAEQAEKWWHRWIYFQPRAFWKPWLDWSSVVDGVHVLRHRDEDKFSELFRLFVEVESWSRRADALSVDLAFNRLEHILLSCARQDTDARNKPTVVDERVLSACTLISENLKAPFTVQEIADHVCLSPSRLSHLFRAFMGTGVIKWRDAQRVQYAMQILRITNVPIKSLSEMVGYDDPLYFSRVFRKHTGMSPRAFRTRSIDLGAEPAETLTTAVGPANPPPDLIE